MLKKRVADFRMLVWSAVAQTGSRNAPLIADAVLAEAFPATAASASHEGADKMLRIGVIDAVKRILRQEGNDVAQADFSDLDPMFAPIVKRLASRSYFVVARKEYVTVRELIDEPALLDDARGYMRRKGEECLEEARILDQLYRAVTGR